MNIKLFKKVLKDNKFDYQTPLSLKEISIDKILWKRDDVELNYCVYFIIDTWDPTPTKFLYWDFPFKLAYIGSGTFSTNSQNSRPYSHKHDLLSNACNRYPYRYKILLVFTNISKNESQAVEALFINMAFDYYHYKRSETNSFNVDIDKDQLYNKKRELKTNTLFNKRIINGNFFKDFTKRKSDNN